MFQDLKSLLTGEDKTWAYFDEKDPATALKAVDDLDAFVESYGPYDGVITFSYSSGVVATWMTRRLRQGKSTFKCAIFLSASSPAVDYNSLLEEKIVSLPVSEMGGAITIPTAHIWGSKDPHAQFAADLSMLCDPQLRSVYVHDRGHEVPGAGSKEAVTSTVNMIRRATLMARETEVY
ncbi:MAG: hypothetical protein Q9227_005005 [Pyrenula ochraceoflavens]